ncbi:MAG: hypothetical protein ACLUGF_13385 [Clostridium sp.]
MVQVMFLRAISAGAVMKSNNRFANRYDVSAGFFCFVHDNQRNMFITLNIGGYEVRYSQFRLPWEKTAYFR